MCQENNSVFETHLLWYKRKTTSQKGCQLKTIHAQHYGCIETYSLKVCVHDSSECLYAAAVWSPQSRSNERQWRYWWNTGVVCASPLSRQPSLPIPHIHTRPPQKPHLLTWSFCGIMWHIVGWERLSQALKSFSFPCDNWM